MEMAAPNVRSMGGRVSSARLLPNRGPSRATVCEASSAKAPRPNAQLEPARALAANPPQHAGSGRRYLDQAGVQETGD